MLESSLLAMPTTTTLSVMRTFMSVPSRDLIESMGPSTASMVPRMRTVGAGWAKAVVPRTDKIASEASARGRNEDIGMDFPSQGGLRSRNITPRPPGYSVTSNLVIPGLVPGIHVFANMGAQKDVDG